MIEIELSTMLGKRKWKQATLHRATGIRKATINELYKGMADKVSMEQLDLICEALDCEVQDIIVRTPNKERRVAFIFPDDEVPRK